MIFLLLFHLNFPLKTVNKTLTLILRERNGMISTKASERMEREGVEFLGCCRLAIPFCCFVKLASFFETEAQVPHCDARTRIGIGSSEIQSVRLFRRRFIVSQPG